MCIYINTEYWPEHSFKYSSFYVRKHSCNVQFKNSFSNDISVQPVNLDPKSETLSPSKSSDYLGDMNYDNPLSSNVNESPNFNPAENDHSMQSQVTSQNTEHNLQNNAINDQALKYTSTEKPNVQQYVKHVKYANSDDIGDAQLISRAGKASGKNKNWYNI